MKIKQQLSTFLKSFFSVWAVIRITSLPIYGIFPIIFMVLFYLLFSIPYEIQNKHLLRTAKWIGIFFSLCYLLGGSQKILLDLDNLLFCTIILTVTGLGLYFIFSQCLFFLFLNIHKISICYTGQTFPKRYHTLLYPFLGFGSCMLGWFPYLLANFPGVMTVDSFNQYAQIIGTYAYSNHHPWIHTLLIKSCYNFGLLFTDNPSTAISFYTVFQMLFMAFCVAYFVFLMCRLHVKTLYIWAAILFYTLVPYNGMYAVTLWKDIPFAGLFFLFSMTLLQLSLLKKEEMNQKSSLFLLVIHIAAGTLMCLFRSNGWYSYLLCLPFILVCLRKKIKFVLPANVILIALVIVIKGPVMDYCGVLKPDLVESLSIPIQQVARLFVEDRPLDSKDIALLNNVMDTSAIEEVYDSHCSDNIKRLIRKGNPDYFKDHIRDFGRLWVRNSFAYPLDYYHAYLDQTYGYWYPDASYSVIFNEEIADNEFGLESSPAFRGPLFIKWKEILFKLNTIIPIYGTLFGIGTLFWIVITCLGLVISKKNYKPFILYIPGIALILTLMIATPVYAEFRYAYAMIFSMPLYMIAALKKDL